MRALHTVLTLSLTAIGCGGALLHLGGPQGVSPCGATALWSDEPVSLRAHLFPPAEDTASVREAEAMRALWYPALQASDRVELEVSPAACRRALLALQTRDPRASGALTAQPGVNVVILRVGPYWKVDLWDDPPPGLLISGGGNTWVVERSTSRIVAGPLVGL